MLYPLKHLEDGDLQIMPSGEFDKLSCKILEIFANANTLGHIFLTNPGNATSIGSFTDTYTVGDIGEDDDTLLSDTYTIYQDNNYFTSSLQKHLVYDPSSNNIRRAAVEEIEELADTILNFCVDNDGPGTYRIATSTPSDGGVWVSQGSITEKKTFSDSGQEYFLYKKINHGPGYEFNNNRLLKLLVAAGQQRVIQKFTDTDLTQLMYRVQQRIYETGIGQYAFQATAPSEGTWVSKGNVADIRYTVADFNYVNELEEYEGLQQYSISNVYTANVSFDAPIASGYDASYVAGPTLFTGTRVYTTAIPYTTFEGYTNDGPAIVYSAPVYITGPTDFTDSATYTNEYAGGFYIGLNTYLLTYDSGEYVGFIEYLLTYQSAFEGTGPYTGFETVSELYQGAYSGFTGYVTNYQGTYSNYVEWNSPYTPTYSGFTSYTTEYQGTYENFNTWTGSYFGTYQGPVSFDGTVYVGAYSGPANFFGPSYQATYTNYQAFDTTNPANFQPAFLGTVGYDGDLPTTYDFGYSGRLTFESSYLRSFTSGGEYTVPDTGYTGQYEGLVLFNTSYLLSFLGGAEYTNPDTGYTGQYEGLVLYNIPALYTASYSIINYQTVFGGTSYVGTYSGTAGDYQGIGTYDTSLYYGPPFINFADSGSYLGPSPIGQEIFDGPGIPYAGGTQYTVSYENTSTFSNFDATIPGVFGLQSYIIFLGEYLRPDGFISVYQGPFTLFEGPIPYESFTSYDRLVQFDGPPAYIRSFDTGILYDGNPLTNAYEFSYDRLIQFDGPPAYTFSYDTILSFDGVPEPVNTYIGTYTNYQSYEGSYLRTFTTPANFLGIQYVATYIKTLTFEGAIFNPVFTAPGVYDVATGPPEISYISTYINDTSPLGLFTEPAPFTANYTYPVTFEGIEGIFSRNYDRETLDTQFNALVPYQGTYITNITFENFSGIFLRSYDRETPESQYESGASQYIGSYDREATFTGPALYEGYLGEFSLVYTAFLSYEGTAEPYSLEYIGYDTYTGVDTQYVTAYVLGSVYTSYLPGTAYEGPDYTAGPITYVLGLNYTSYSTFTSALQQFSNPEPGIPYDSDTDSYTSSYTGEVNYISYQTFDVPDTFLGAYSKALINSEEEIITNIYLWRRVA